MKLNIGVIFGGKSVEHEISIISACEIMGYIDPNKYNVIPIYIDKENNWYTGLHLKDIINYRDIDLVKRYAKKVTLIRNGKRILLQSLGLLKRNLYVIDLILPIGHGTYMEDGTIQGYLKMLDIPYIGSSVLASAIAQDKVVCKDVLKSNNIPTSNYVWFSDYKFINNKKKVLEKVSKLKYPMFVKPANLGSSIGINLVNNEKELTSAIKEALNFDNKILIEEAIPNLKEVNVSVMAVNDKLEVTNIEELNVNEEFYSFKEKYVNGFSKNIIKSNKTNHIVSKEMIEDIKKYAISTFKAIGASGVARIDFLIDTKNLKIYVGEVNTIPGSLASYLWVDKKVSQQELIDILINTAIYDYERRNNLTYSFCPNLLESFDNLKGKKTKKDSNEN